MTSAEKVASKLQKLALGNINPFHSVIRGDRQVIHFENQEHAINFADNYQKKYPQSRPKIDHDFSSSPTGGRAEINRTMSGPEINGMIQRPQKTAVKQPNGNLLGPHQRLNPDVALKKQVPFGKENRTKAQIKSDTVKRIGESMDAIMSDKKIRPAKPKGKDYQRIISASLDELKSSLAEAKIAIAHNHHIEWRSTKIASQGEPKAPKMVGKYAKYWLLNAKDVNGNGWGVNRDSIDHNIGYFVNRPFVITAKSWVPNSAYDTYDHPYLPTNDLYAVLKHQEPYRVGTIREVTHEGDDYYAIIEMLPKYAHMALPAFCSPAIFQV